MNTNRYHYKNLFTDANNAILERTYPLLEPHMRDFANRFYSELLRDPCTAQFLDNEVVEKRLKNEMARWIQETLSPKSDAAVQSSVRLQHRVGEVHARIEIPMAFVNSGMTILKEAMFEQILHSRQLSEQKLEAIVCVSKILDSAVSLINESYLRGKVEHALSHTEYHSAATAQDLALEIERAKSSMYDWMTKEMFKLLSTETAPASSILGQDFSLWIKHKLRLIIGDSERYDKILQQLSQADQQFRQLGNNPALSSRVSQIQRITQSLNEVIWLLTEEANANLEKAAQQDSLTFLLERRFVNPILQRETTSASQSAATYSIIMADIDHFKHINDNHGHQVGDQVLGRLGKLIKESIRLTDYAFRYGGEEILILAPELPLVPATRLAERICHQVEQMEISLGNKQNIRITISLGVAEFSGHPDYQQVINAADQKLYEAKHQGRNRVCY